MPEVDLSICIVNHKNRDLLSKCLNSIYSEPAGVSFQVLVLDNCSKDGSLEMLSESYPQVRVFANSEPKGFAQNQGQLLQHCIDDSKFLLILNDDTETLPSDFKSSVGYMITHPEVGALGFKIYRPDGDIQPSAWSFPTWLKEAWRFSGLSENLIKRNDALGALVRRILSLIPSFQRQIHTYSQNFEASLEPREVDWVCGAAMMLRREALQDIGLLDQDYYMYYEDVDWCKRARGRGWKVVFYPMATIVHHGQMSQSRSSILERQRSAFRYFRLHHGRLTEITLRSVITALATAKVVLLCSRWIIERNNRPAVRDELKTSLSILLLTLGSQRMLRQ